MPSRGLAVRVPANNSAILAIKKSGLLPLYGRPHHLQVPGGTVALVQAEGHVVMVARALSLEGPGPVRLVDGKKVKKRIPIETDES